MFKKIIDFTTNFISKIAHINKGTDTYDVLKYRISVIVTDSWKYAVLFLLSVFFNVFPLVLAITATTVLIRSFSHGFHLKNGLLCLIAGTSSFLLPAILLKDVSVPTSVRLAVYGISFYTLYHYAPVATVNQPFSKKSSDKNKKATLIICLCLLPVVVLSKGFGVMVLSSIVMCAIGTIPALYKLFGNEVIEYSELKIEVPQIEVEKKTSQTSFKNSMEKAKTILIEQHSKIYLFLQKHNAQKNLQAVSGVFVFCAAFTLIIVPAQASELSETLSRLVRCAPPSWFEDVETPECIRKELMK